MADLTSNALQENLLTLLSYDDKYAPIIRGSVEPHMFGGLYNEIIVRIYTYIDKEGVPPKDHLPDLLEDKLTGKKKREVHLYEDIIYNVKELSEGINAEYVMGQLENFVRRQSLKLIAIDLAKELQKDTEASLEEADRLISNARIATLKVFEPGTNLANVKDVLRFLDMQIQSFPLGIHELDIRGIGPVPKELLLLIAPSKKGKSWWLIFLGKMALVHNYKVSHVTLEMSEERVTMRYMQTFFALSKRDKDIKNRVRFKRNKRNRIKDFEYFTAKANLSLTDPKITKKLTKLIKKWGKKVLKNIYIKEFPTSTLSVSQLKAYLDNLAITKKFHPDLLIIDYPDLMKLDSANLRLELDQIFKELRGIAVERNIAVAVVSQSHRSAEKIKQVGADNVAEAYSKIAHADCIITYSQTDDEKTYGLARLFVAGSRNDEDKFTIVISQNYAMGQFAIDSTMQTRDYWELLEGTTKEEG